jgi:hypothetical protein
MKSKRMKMSQREPGHTERNFQPKMSAARAHGSPRSYSQVGSGPVPGAGEMPRIGPGKAAMRYSGLSAADSGVREAASGATPKGMRVYREE